MVALRNDPAIRCLEPTMDFRLVKLCYPIIVQDRLLGLQEFGAPEFLDSWHMKVSRLSALCTVHIHPMNIFLILIYVRSESTPGP
jgi:hypothetical protein